MSATIYSNSSFTDTPYGLKLQQTISATGTSSVTGIPAGVNRVYAIVIGGGGGGAGIAGNGSPATGD
jgi:branched-subunit amino acid ABC-type transport system permease component